ncbi:MAG: hypothetical protein IJO50_02740, partial [Clostridia bacterium]|nr:hypothetical protein [Clostridia bacterium]
MKIFLVSKRWAFVYVLVFMGALGLLCLGSGDTVSVFSETEGTKRLLPIYCVDRGEEKVCSL